MEIKGEGGGEKRGWGCKEGVRMNCGEVVWTEILNEFRRLYSLYCGERLEMWKYTEVNWMRSDCEGKLIGV